MASIQTQVLHFENYQFDRYCTLHAGLVKMLKSVGGTAWRLNIRKATLEMAGDM